MPITMYPAYDAKMSVINVPRNNATPWSAATGAGRADDVSIEARKAPPAPNSVCIASTAPLKARCNVKIVGHNEGTVCQNINLLLGKKYELSNWWRGF